MKSVYRILLSLFFLPLFLLFLLSTSVRFQVLNENFWITSLEKGNVYGNMVTTLVPEFSKPENDFDPTLAKLLLTEKNLQEFMEKNIHLTLAYVNGEGEELKIFIPFLKLPKGLLPLRFQPSSEELTITELNSFMGGRLPLENIKQASYIGTYSTLVWVVITFLFALVLFLMYAITEKEKRVVLPGVALITVSLPILAFSVLLSIFVNNPPPDVATTTEPATKLVWIIGPVVLQRIARLWMYLASCGLVLGIIVLFVKKPKT